MSFWRHRSRSSQPTRSLAASALVVACLAAPSSARAELVPVTCLEAGMEAERSWGLPAGLLAAIGKIESGRPDAQGGGWPWTINAAGRGQHFNSKAEAIRAVGQHQARGVRSIDVGCFQINLIYHPAAFASLDEGFDPRANAQYAARFLSELQQRAGSWEDAIAAYHSATPSRGDAYRARVYAAWFGAPARTSSPTPVAVPVALPVALPASAPVRVAAAPEAKAVVWTVTAQSMGMRVWTAAAPRRDALAASLPMLRPVMVAAR